MLASQMCLGLMLAVHACVVCFSSAFHPNSGLLSKSPIATSVLMPQQHRLESTRLQLSSKSADTLPQDIAELKRVLKREYTSFFNPMETEYYAPGVVFEDPLTSLSGVESYQKNVDMLASRTLLGSILFKDAGIVLHSIEGGSIAPDGTIGKIETRWTLRMTAKVIPWTPTARFTGVSIYTVEKGGAKGVQIVQQADYWDSINIKNEGKYEKVDRGLAVSDFLSQLRLDDISAPSAGRELPYELLRRGNGYEVRRYPSFKAAKTTYERRDDGFATLGSLTAGSNPLAPAIMSIPSSGGKMMAWPLSFAMPGKPLPPLPEKIVEKIEGTGCEVQNVPERVVAVGSFSNASVEPVVRKTDRDLRDACMRDGLLVSKECEDQVTFTQYDAIFSMGKRRSEVWIDLDESHPWATA